MRNHSTVQQQIECLKTMWVEQYSSTWSRMAAEWDADENEDRVWLIYAANYLLRTGGTRWAIDPLVLSSRVRQVPEVDIIRGLSKLSFVLLTHRHADHLDLQLIHALRAAPIWWVIPEFLFTQVVEEAGVPKSNVIVPKMLEQIRIGAVTITPFDGLHWEEDTSGKTSSPRGIPAVGYLAEFQNKRFLFPGDTRTYEAGQIPAFGAVDKVFAHLWLGRGCALMEKPPLLDAFCTFCLDLQPRHLVITHLNELGREPDDYWDQFHLDLVWARIKQMKALLPLSTCSIGDSVEMV
jgi:hypothetical protein